MNWSRIFALCGLATGSWLFNCGQAVHGQSDEQNWTSRSLPNVKLPTLGGKQLWTDHYWRRGWRIQQNALTGHWRLLDPDNARHAWGTRAACQTELDELVEAVDVADRPIVILLHGLGRSASSMQALGSALTEEGHYQVVYFEYASTRRSVAEHAAALDEVVAGLPATARLNFVGHSMGNIVVRHAYGDWQARGDHATMERIDRIVMLGPPNQGSSIARLMAKTGVFGWVAGPGGLEMGPNWHELESRLATPRCAFGIIAGRLPADLPRNPLVDGAGDFIVSVEETKLDGAADFLEVPCMHTFIMDDEGVQQAVLHFLANGRFE